MGALLVVLGMLVSTGLIILFFVLQIKRWVSPSATDEVMNEWEREWTDNSEDEFVQDKQRGDKVSSN